MQSLKTMNLHVRPLLVAAAIAPILPACNDHALDFRNARSIDGRIYAAETDEPYSGKLVNVPSGLLLKPLVGFNKVMTNLEIALRPLPPSLMHATGFRGFLASADIQAAILCDARVSNGYVDGNATCTTRGTNDVRLEMTFKNGRLNGKLIAYAPETEKHTLAQVAFRDGEPDGKENIYSPATHRLVHVFNWTKGALNGAEDRFEEKTGKRTLHAMFVNGRLDGEVVKYTPDGKRLIATSEAVQACIVSQLVSREKAASELSRGTLPMNEWDTACAEAPHAAPAAGSQTAPAGPPSSAQVTACSHEPTSAYRRDQRANTDVSVGQLHEWNLRCEADKQPA
ncbi:hypothetical protein ACI2UK_13460 [Ralstonia nicotianae]|uniref:hypothetical protein n=1 Tax=Ralstonia pseudosolanacearum TaxID=1310165 RepID=UPI002006C147|nr:hypothetical protein [Ralstonia pseudosolanacearum]MCK4118448.1 hypothetical protein [Ralstonia pseudosolanacearum]